MTPATSASSLDFGELLRGADLSSTVGAVQGVLRDPTANSTLSLVLLSAVVLAVLLLVVFTLMLITPSQKKVVKIRRYTGARPAGADAGSADAGVSVVKTPPKPPSRFFLAMTGPIAITVLVLGAFVGAYVATSTDAYCAKTCHASTEAARSGLEVGHASCISCHGTDGLLGVLANVSDRGRMLVSYAVGRSPRRATIAVDSYACLGCHGDVRTEIVASENGVVMSHAEVIEGGEPCTGCHAASGHSAAAFTASMSACITCHDSRTASAECKTCHSSDPGSISFAKADSTESMGSGSISYPAVRAATRDCGGCHDQEAECDYCHGMRMPHTAAFKAGGHAIAAAFERKLACWRCHDPQVECDECHTAAFDPGTGNTTHGSAWKQEHRTAAWTAGCVCHSARSDRTGPICTLCHAADRSLLPVTQ